MPAAPSSAHTGARHERLDPRVSATRARVLAAVGELLEHGGVTDVTHASVARVAGVGRATVYRHWPMLDSLLVDAVEERLGVIHLVLSGDPLTDLRTMLVTLSAGPHRVTCTTAEGKAQTATVTVPADGTARHKFTL